MILKELDPFSGSDKFLVAGRRAEEQMAHYLRRFFANSAHVDVLNYLRISLGGEVAQIDHLVLHPFGLTIVESKSVASSVQIKDDGQWVRWFDKRPQGMRSPITQAKMQAMLLRELLALTVKQKGFFDGLDLGVLVAISDSGTIQRPAGGAYAEVCKADQVPDRILETIATQRGAGAAEVLSAQHRQSIAQFLLKVHQPVGANLAPAPAGKAAFAAAPAPLPLPPVEVSSPPAAERPELPPKVCKHCQSGDVQAQYGKFGYYFLCGSCAKNTSIKFACPQCGGEGRIRKQGKDFFAECRACDASTLYHSNP